MYKRLISFLLAFVMILQIFTPSMGFAMEKISFNKNENLLNIGEVSTEDYPSIDTKLILERNKEVARNRKQGPIFNGVSLRKSEYVDGGDPSDSNKPKYFGRVSAELITKGLDNGTFNWGEIFGQDSNGANKPVKIEFHQLLDDVPTGIQFSLEVNQNGTYKWVDGKGNPTLLPLYSVDFKAFKYSVFIDKGIAEKVKLIISLSAPTPDVKFEKEGDRYVADIKFKIDIQQVAATNFSSVWKTGVAEADRPQIIGKYIFTEGSDDIETPFNFPKDETSRTVIRDGFVENFVEDEDNDILAPITDELINKPKEVKVDDTSTSDLIFDSANKTVKYGVHKYKYVLDYDVINGGKLTMTEIIPVTFDANGGKFANFTAPDTETKIVKEVEYDSTLTDKAENPTKDSETFKGWSLTKGGAIATDADFANIKEAKTFYAIWDNNDIVADQLEVKESFKDGTGYVNDFIPTLDTLKGKVKIKDANGVSQPLANDDTFAIVDGSNEYKADGDDLKNYLYGKLQEKDNPNDEPTRVETVKAKISHANGTSQTVDIPIKVVKNIYEAKTLTEKPYYVPSDYVKVTVDPTTKATDPQKTYYYVNPEAKVVIPGSNPTGKDDYKFIKWTIPGTPNPIEYKLADRHQFSGETTIAAQYSKDVIPQEGDTKPEGVPDNFVKVTFVPTDKGTMEGAKIFWVNPAVEVTIPVNNPVGKTYYTFKEWKMGANADGAVYNPSTPTKFTDTNGTTITATYDEAKNIIPYDPSLPDPMVRPKGYVRVTFAADPGLKLTESKAYYVKKNAKDTNGDALTLKAIKDDATNYGYPAYKEETGYNFEKWDLADTTTIGTTDIVVKAKATKLDTVIPEKTGGTLNDKPEGYKEVTFVVKTGDEDKGSITGVAKFYVNPTEYVTINPPTTKAETGFEFGAWDKDATIPTVYKDDTKIAGSFNGLKDVIPKTNPDGTENKQPAGYKKVEFVIDPATGGKIADGEVTVYYVNPAKEVTVPQPKTAADTGYEFEKWDKDTATAKKYTEDTTVKGNFKKLDDIIPSTDPTTGDKNAKPEGYVTVTFVKGDHGKEITGQTVYYVNPKADPVKTLADIAKPTVKAETGYKFTGWDTKDDFEIKDNKTVIAQYEEIADVIPKDKPTGGENDKPEGYITVTFDKGANGELEGNTIFYVNPNKAVVLEDKAPTIKPNTGYTSAGWDTTINKAIQYKDGDKVTALYNKLGDVIPQEKTDGSDKPAGYLTVTFDKGANGELSGKTVYYVKPNTEVTVPAPTVKPAVGYEFEKWDKELTQTFTADNTKITAEYKALDNIIPQKNTDGSDRPEGYHTVTFKAVNGSLEGKTVYYVKPDVEVDLNNTANGITKKANVGYTEEGGTWDPAIVKQQYTKDETYTFTFKALADVIEKIDENTKKPEGYITVVVKPTDKATDATEKTYFVNPTKEVTIPFAKPTGKDVPVDASNPKAFKWIFTKWTSDEVPTRVWETGVDTGITAKFTNDTTTITAEYEKSITDQGSVIADEITVHESYKDGDTWVNNFVDTEATEAILKGALKVNGGALPSDATVVFLDDTGNAYADEAALKAALYDKLQEKNDGNKPSRIEQLKAKVTFKNGEVQTVDIPIKVIKNIYEAKTLTEKPFYVPDGYLKVTVDPTTKATNPQKTYYYVNPEAKLVIPGKDPTGVGDNKFVKWTYDDNGTETEYKLADKPRHQFKSETTITAQYVSDVIPQEGTEKPDTVPANFVEVKFVPTDKATDETKAEKIFWVNPEKEVTIPVNNPVGKTYYTFKEWKLGANADGDPYNPSTAKKFTEATTITATYDEAKNIIPYDPVKDPTTRPDGYVRVTFIAEKGLKLENVKHYYVKKNAGIKLDNAELIKPEVKAETGYEFVKWDPEDTTEIKGTDIVVTAKAKELDSFIPADGNTKPEGYVTVTFVAGDHGTIAGTTKYWVNPTAEKKLSDIPHPSVTANDGWKYTGWDKEDTTEITTEIEVTAKYLEKVLTTDPNDAENYVKVEFKQGEHGTIDANATSTYWVLKDEAVTLTPPTVIPDTGYAQKTGDEAWSPQIATSYSKDTEHVAQYDYNGDDVISQTGPEKPDNVPGNFVLVEFKPGDHGTITGTTKYWVNPTKLVTLIPPSVTPNTGYVQERGLGAWDRYLRDIFTDKLTVITAQYRKLEEPCPPTPPTPPTPDYPNDPNKPYIPMYPEVRYETIVQEKIVKVPVPIADNAYIKEVRYMQGFKGDFRPKDGLTRAEAAQILANALVEDGYKYNASFKLPYRDIGEAWYTRAVKIVTEAKVFAGYDDGNFKPQDKITRNEWIATLKRFQELGDASGNHMNLKDGHWAMGEIEAAYKEGWLKIYTEGLATYEGDKFIPREEVAAVSNKAFNRVLDKTYIENNYKNLIGYKDVKKDMWSYYDILCASNTFLYKKDLYRAHWIKEDNNLFNINTDGFEIVKAKFQRNPR